MPRFETLWSRSPQSVPRLRQNSSNLFDVSCLRRDFHLVLLRIYSQRRGILQADKTELGERMFKSYSEKTFNRLRSDVDVLVDALESGHNLCDSWEDGENESWSVIVTSKIVVSKWSLLKWAYAHSRRHGRVFSWWAVFLLHILGGVIINLNIFASELFGTNNSS